MGKSSRKNTNNESTELVPSTIASNTNFDEFAKLFYLDNISPQDMDDSAKNRSLLTHLMPPEMKIYWENLPSQPDGSGIKKVAAPTASKNKTYNTQHFQEHSPFDLRDDRSSFTEDRHGEDDARTNVLAPGSGSVVHVPPRHHDVTRPPTWTTVHHPRAPFITFWPVGILMMAVFIVGFVSLVLCRVMATSRPTYSRRNMRPCPRQALSPRSMALDDGGFGDRSRRRADNSASSGSNPPRAATPPPPYPGSPPGATVYVNPLDVKTCHLFVPTLLSSLRRNCSATPTPGDQELPPPYPGTWIANTNPESPQPPTNAIHSDPTSHTASTNSSTNCTQTTEGSSIGPEPPKRVSSNRKVGSTTRIHNEPSDNLKTIQVTTAVPTLTLNAVPNSDTI